MKLSGDVIERIRAAVLGTLNVPEEVRREAAVKIVEVLIDTIPPATAKAVLIPLAVVSPGGGTFMVGTFYLALDAESGYWNIKQLPKQGGA